MLKAVFPFKDSVLGLQPLALDHPDMTKSVRTDAKNGVLRVDLRSNLRHRESRVVEIGRG